MCPNFSIPDIVGVVPESDVILVAPAPAACTSAAAATRAKTPAILKFLISSLAVREELPAPLCPLTFLPQGEALVKVL